MDISWNVVNHVLGFSMVPGQTCYRLNNGPPCFTLPHRVKLADGSTRTDASQWFPEHGESLGWVESVVTAEEAAAYEAGVLSQERDTKLATLNQWWKSLEASWPTTLGFSIKADAQRLTALQLSVLLAGMRLQQGAGSTSRVWDANETLHMIDDAVFVAAAQSFEAGYLAKEQIWINVTAALNSATSLEQLNAVEMP